MHFVRGVAYFLIVSGLLFLGDAVREQQRGIARAARLGRGGVSEARRIDDPKAFEGLMFYQWARAGLTVLAGMTILGMCRRADLHDPFSEQYHGSAALDELGKTLDEEKEQRQRPPHRRE
jgi:hypothetical protein